MGGTKMFALAIVIIAAVAVFSLVKNFSGMAISTTYHYIDGGYGPQKGIGSGALRPSLQYPGLPEIKVYGSRFPAFLILGTASWGELSQCRSDLLFKAHITGPGDRFVCFTVPQYGTGHPVQAFTYGLNSDVFCYARTTGAGSQGIDSEAAVRDKINEVLVGRPDAYPWTQIYVRNLYGKTELTPVCGASLKPLHYRYG